MANACYQKKAQLEGDTLAMAIGKTLIDHLKGIAKQVWYADDSSAGSTVLNGDMLKEIGPQYGYFSQQL